MPGGFSSPEEAKAYEHWLNTFLKAGISKAAIAKALGIPVGKLATGPIPAGWRHALAALARAKAEATRELAEELRRFGRAMGYRM